MNLKSLLQDVPEVFQYIAVLGLVMLILYVCLKITALIGRRSEKKTYYDDPEAYEKTVPDVFASTFLKRKPKGEADADSDADGDSD